MIEDTGRIVFDAPNTGSGHIVFGELSGEITEVHLEGALPAPGAAAALAKVKTVQIAGALPAPGAAAHLTWNSATDRPLAAGFRSSFNDALPLDVYTRAKFQDSQRAIAGVTAKFADSTPRHVYARARFQDSIPLRKTLGVRFQQDIQLSKSHASSFQQSIPLRKAVAGRFQEDIRLTHGTGGRFQQSIPVKRTVKGRFQEDIRVSKGWVSSAKDAIPLNKTIRGRFQQDMQPQAGRIEPPIVVPPDVCYIPDGRITFDPLWTGSGRIVLFCELHNDVPLPPASIIVPVKKVYIVNNSATLIRIEGGAVIKTYGMNLSLDVDSWTWGFSAVVDIASKPALVKNAFKDPVLLQATVNGTNIVLVLDKIGSTREFNNGTIRISGRGKNALLESPIAPKGMYFNNYSDEFTAQQLMLESLKLNGVSIGWDVDFQLTDWLVPAGAWSHVGTWRSAVSTIAAAAGGYVQPHNTADTLRILPRYPAAPWDWSTLTPDYEIPSDVATIEGIDYQDKAVYTRVFVEGTAVGGRRGQVTRAGTDGSLLAELVVDPLITHVDAARQRGMSILADTGSQEFVNITMPVLSSTGIIMPGKTVRYVDGSDVRFGIVRSASVQVDGQPETWQTFGVETHVD